MAAGRLTRPRRTAVPLDFIDIILAAGVTALWAASLVPLFDFAIGDRRLLEAFSIDELIQLNLLRGAASAHTFALHFGPYGHFVFNLILALLRLIPGEATDGRILYIGRFVNLAFGAGTALLTFAWARRAYGRAASWIAFSAVIVNATLYIGVAQVQPDIAQLFFLTASLACTARLADEPQRRWLVAASATAGLAFACKYSGVFVLPIIAAAVARRPIAVTRPAAAVNILRLSVFAAGAAVIALGFVLDTGWIAAHLTEDGSIAAFPLSPQLLRLTRSAAFGAGVLAMLVSAAPLVWRRLRQWLYGLAVLWAWLVAAATFVTAFVVTSPYSLRKAAFVKGLLGEAGFAAPVSLASQVEALRGMAVVIGWPMAIAALATIVVLTWRARSPFRLSSVDAVLLAWILIYIVVLLLPAHEFYVDYALPLAPAVAMLAARGAVGAFEWLGASAPQRRTLAAVALVIVVVAAEVPIAMDLLHARAQQRQRTTNSVQAYVAAWLQCRAPATTRIAYDYFVYVPSTYRSVFVTWGGTKEWLAAIDPDLVIVEAAAAGYAAGNPDHRAYYECLAAESCGYERALTKDALTVYVRKGRRADVLNEARAQLSARGCS